MSCHFNCVRISVLCFLLNTTVHHTTGQKMQNFLLCYNTSRQFFTSDGTWQDGFASRNKTGFHFYSKKKRCHEMNVCLLYSCSHNCSIKSTSINFFLLVYCPPQSYRNKKEMRCLFCYLSVIFLLNTISSHQ